MAERDDWFEDVEQEPAALANDPASAEDDWFVPLPSPSRRRPALQQRRVLVVAGAFVVLLLAGLAAGGVFSSSSSPPPAAITSAGVTTAPTTTAPAATSVKVLPSTTLKPGDTGAQVKALQRALKSLGYSVGTVDGQYGPTTKEAVASFQHDAQLTADGIFGPKTLNALIQRAGP